MMAPPKDPTFEIDNVKGDYNMATKELNARIPQKHDTEANWNKAENFRPMAGEFIVYDPDANYSYARFKIGDGNTIAKDLPFAAAAVQIVTWGAND